MPAIPLTEEYGFVILAAAGSMVVNFWQMMNIGKLRRKHKILYPVMISEKHEDFNCAQRAHQNTLENLPFFLVNLLLGGVRFPKYAAIAGGVFLLGRVVYSIGYYTGKPERRVPGAIMSTLLGMFPLFGMAIGTGAGLLGWF